MLEGRLREQIAELGDAGLAADEAFLIAAKRLGALDEAIAAMPRTDETERGERVETAGERSDTAGERVETAGERSDTAGERVETAGERSDTAGERSDTVDEHAEDAEKHTEAASEQPGGLWQRLGLAAEASSVEARREFIAMGSLACAAAVAVKAPELFGLELEHFDQFYARNLSLLVLPFLAGYFAWKRRLAPRRLALLAAPFVAVAVIVNVYPFEPGSDVPDTEVLAALHLPILLWLVVGFAHAAGDWRSHDKRMDFVRFTGEWCLYYGLIALGGGVFAGSAAGIFAAIGLDAGQFIGLWLVPCGAAGAVVVAAWLAESRQGVLERIAPVLTRLFTPMFAALLAVFLIAVALTGRGIDVGRGVLIFFDLLLALILGLVIYSIAVRDRQAPPGLFDILQLALVITALLVDLLVLGAIVSRLSDFGTTPNRIAALGENLVLLVNLAWSAWLYFGFWRGRRPFAALERWQTAYAPVYAVWAAGVVVAFPLVFSFA